jgi:hypothetical protein
MKLRATMGLTAILGMALNQASAIQHLEGIHSALGWLLRSTK